MKATLILPVASLRGQLRKDGYYFRMYRGEQIVQSCPRVYWSFAPVYRVYCSGAAVYKQRSDTLHTGAPRQ